MLARAGVKGLLRDASILSTPEHADISDRLIQDILFLCRTDLDWVLTELRNRASLPENRLAIAKMILEPHREKMLAELERE